MLIVLVIYVALLAGSIPGATLREAHGESLIDEVFGNFTFVGQPVKPVEIEEGEIPIGKAGTFTYDLEKGHRYHIYLCGEWADPKTHETDYDVYVYEITKTSANFRSSHTESAGLPEQVGNDGFGRYFIPGKTGTYYFNVRNDALESSASEAGTFFVVEHIDTDDWVSRRMRGKVDDRPVEETNWAYEFVTSAKRIRVQIDVPSTLDMYEARLYVMASPAAGKGQLLREIPIAWEPGLRGVLSGVYGGFNFEPQGFRHLDAMDSCEFNGEDMVIDYKVPVGGELLFHLALIAEYGSGTIDFLVQTDFEAPEIEVFDPPELVYEEAATELRLRVEDESSVEEVSLEYTVDGGENWLDGTVHPGEGGNYTGVIPPLDPGDLVEYRFTAVDSLGNVGEAVGEFEVWGISRIDVTLYDEEILGGDAFTVRGRLRPAGRELKVYYENSTDIFNFTLSTDYTGFFRHDFTPERTGGWMFHLEYEGEENYHPRSTEALNFTVAKRNFTLTCEVRDSKILGGDLVDVWGRLLPGGREVQLYYAQGDELHNFTVEASVSDGYFNHSFRPTATGEWRVHANCSGEVYYNPAEAEGVNFTVESVQPLLTCAVSKMRIENGKPVTLSGRFGIEKAGVSVVLFLRAPNGTKSLIASTSSGGEYTETFRPDSKGLWEIQAEVRSDGLVYETVTSSPVELRVITPSLTTTILRRASALAARGEFLARPPFLYGIIGIGIIGGGGIVFFLRRRE